MRAARLSLAVFALLVLALPLAVRADTGRAPAADTPSRGAALDAEAPMLEHAEDVADYTMVAKLDAAAHTIHGEGTIRWRNTSGAPAHELWVHLYLNAFKNEGSAYLREPVGGFRGSEPLTEWGYIDVRRFAIGEDGDLWPKAELRRPGDEDETDARVPLAHEVLPGETVTIDVAWDSKLPSVLERTGHAGNFNMVGQWFPKIARLEPSGIWAHFPFHHLAEFYADFGTYDVTMDVPEAYVIGATGPVVESHVAAGRRIERHVQADIHDFAWTAWDEWQTGATTIDGVKVTILYPPGFKSVADRELDSMRFAIPDFHEKYGRYPYPVLTLVHPPERAAEAGGMEYPTLITTGGPWYGPPGVWIPEIVTVHEFGHQYFYGLIASNEVDWPFLDEGLNSYAEADTMGAWKGDASAVDLVGLHVSDSAAHAVRARDDEHDQPVAQPAYAFATGSAYASLVYSRTATILETLRRVHGDAAFTRAMGLYARRWRFRHPAAEDFVHAMADVLGADAGRALHAALFEKAWVDYALTEVFSRKASTAAGVYDRQGKRETVATAPRSSAGDDAYEGWVLVTRRGSLTFPVDVDLVLEDDTHERLHWDGKGDTVRLSYRGRVAIRAAIVDPDHAILLDDNVTNNFARAPESPSAGAPRTLERGTYWAEILLELVSP